MKYTFPAAHINNAHSMAESFKTTLVAMQLLTPKSDEKLIRKTFRVFSFVRVVLFSASCPIFLPDLS